MENSQKINCRDVTSIRQGRVLFDSNDNDDDDDDVDRGCQEFPMTWVLLNLI